jgi:outer membrane immunogenic protein
MKIVWVGAVLLGTAGNALAADLPARVNYTKAPIAVVYDWTGIYFGANAGVGVGRDRTQLAVAALPSAETSLLAPMGGIAGAQVGYNWQSAQSFLGDPIVIGIEADIQGAGLRDSRNCLLGCVAGGPIAQFDQKLDWFGTVRGRAGFARGPVLSYFTAGYAYGGVRTQVNETLGGVTGSFTTDQTRSGWTYGSGVEAALGGNWSGKIEYLYLNLGNNRVDGYALGGVAHNLSTEIREHIFRVGLNYRIGGNGTYVPVAAADWSGLYAGGNFGSGRARDRSTLAIAGTGINEQFNLTPDGFLGGVQGGYNWQAANWVFGVEADIQGSTQKDDRACVLFCGGGAAFASYNAKLPWLGTARGRLGYSLGSTLFYATGGFAYAGIKTDLNSSIGGVNTQSFSSSKGGWTAGVGIERPFTFLGLLGPSWTSKTEYLYLDLGKASNVFSNGGVTAIFDTRVQEHIFRSGINYHFSSPVVAKY